MGLSLSGLSGNSGIGVSNAPPPGVYGLIVPQMTGTSSPQPYVVTNNAVLNSTYAAWKLFDRLFGSSQSNSRWLSPFGATTNRIFVIDFGVPKNVEEIAWITAFEADRSCRNAILEYSDDNTNWTQAISITDAPNGIFAFTGLFSFPSVSARYWRFTALNNWGDPNYTSFSEFYFYGTN